ncbi:hypothetical protein HDV57DRAFT_488143 [Trichoderma longibrachiatum]
MDYTAEQIDCDVSDMAEVFEATECSQPGSSLLDFDTSVLLGSPPPFSSGNTTQALCFENNDFSFLENQPTSFTPLPMPSQISLANNPTKTDDISLYHSILYRLDSIEAAVSTSNSQIDQFNSTFAFVLSKLTSSEEIIVAIKDLKQTMKSFINAILGQVLGQVIGQGEELLEAHTKEEV